MDPELKQLLEENLRVARDTNAILRGMRATARWAFIGKIVLYALVIIVPLFFIQSYLAPYMRLLGGGGNSQQDTQNLIQQYQDLLK